METKKFRPLTIVSLLLVVSTAAGCTTQATDPDGGALLDAGDGDTIEIPTNLQPVPKGCHDVEGTLPYTSMSPPNGALITVGEADAEGFVVVSGKAGALNGEVPLVALVGLELGTEACVRPNADGSFVGRIHAPAGISIYLAPVERGDEPSSPADEWGMCHHIAHGDGMLLSRPEVNSMTGPWTAYGALPGGKSKQTGEYGAYSLRSKYWRVKGDMKQIELMVRGLDPSACLRPAIKVERLFDANGAPRATHDNSHQGIPMTPTGLPVEATPSGDSSSLQFLETDCLTGQSDRDLVYTLPDFSAGLEDGWYRVRIVLTDWSQDTHAFKDAPPATYTWDKGLLGPPLKIGSPATPKLPWVLFAETASAGSGGARGIVPTELKESYALNSRVTLTPPTMIFPRKDPATGKDVPYRLEPWLPSISGEPFQSYFPSVPLIPLSPETATLTVTIETPDGGQKTIGPANLSQSIVAASAASPFLQRPGGSHSFAGPNRTLGLTTRDDTFVHTFSTDGLYTIRINGEVSDIWGNRYEGGGTYHVWVARALVLPA